MQKYTIELSEDQLRLIAQCLEDVSRFASGQWEMRYMVEEMVRVAAPKDFEKQIELRDDAEMYLRRARNVLIDFPENASYSYNSKEFIGNTYQIYRSIWHELLKDTEDWNVYHSPARPSGTMGTIKIQKLDGESL